VTWTKLGDEFPAEARDLSDAAFRTHVEALVWSNTRLLDLRIPKGDLKRFAESLCVDLAVAELVQSGWWRDRGATWDVGRKHPEWQPSRKSVEEIRAAWRARDRRRRSKRSNKKVLPDPTRPDPGSPRDSRSDSRSDSRREKTDPDQGFSDFWSVYPRQVGESKARAVWREIVREFSPEEVTSAAARFASSINGVPRRRVVWPARWLSERWWLDYPPERKLGPTTGNGA
jgi:hypothetical protein